MSAPQAVSLAVGSMLVVVLSYRTIFAVMGAVIAMSLVYVAVTLRDQITDDVRRPVAEGPDALSAGTVDGMPDPGVVPTGALEP